MRISAEVFDDRKFDYKSTVDLEIICVLLLNDDKCTAIVYSITSNMKKKIWIESTSRNHNYYTNGLGYMFVSENAALAYNSICTSFVPFTWENPPNLHRNHKKCTRAWPKKLIFCGQSWRGNQHEHRSWRSKIGR